MVEEFGDAYSGIFWLREVGDLFVEFGEEVNEVGGKVIDGVVFVPDQSNVSIWFEHGFPVSFCGGLVEPMECLGGGDEID